MKITTRPTTPAGAFMLLTVMMMMMMSAPPSVDAVLQLTVENFEAMTAGKSVFIKFFAPWCGHCRAMEEDWQKLEDDWKGHEYALVAEVDCTSDGGQPICEDFEIQGFPTLVFGDPLSAEPYDGSRDYESLSAHAKEHIAKPVCSIHRMEACSADDQTAIVALLRKTTDELEEIVTKVSDRVQLEESSFEEVTTAIQQQYDAAVKDYNAKLDAIKKEFHYKFVEQLITVRFDEAQNNNNNNNNSGDGDGTTTGEEL